MQETPRDKWFNEASRVKSLKPFLSPRASFPLEMSRSTPTGSSPTVHMTRPQGDSVEKFT